MNQDNTKKPGKDKQANLSTDDVPVSFLRLKTQYENIGDRLINRELAKYASTYGEVILCESGVPQAFLEEVRAGLDYRMKSNSFNFYLSMLAYAISGKRTYFLQNPGGYTAIKEKNKLARSVLKIFIEYFLKLSGVKIVLYGASFDKSCSITAMLYRLKSKYYHVLCVRDTISFEALKTAGVRRLAIAPDLAFALPYNESTGKNIDYLYSFRTLSNQTNESKITHLVSFGDKKGAISFYSQVDFDRDKKFDLEHVGEVSVNSIADALSVIAKARYVISNRLHVLLEACSQGVVPIALIETGKNEKIEGIFCDMGLENHVFYLEALDSVEDFYEKISGLRVPIKSYKQLHIKSIESAKNIYVI